MMTSDTKVTYCSKSPAARNPACRPTPNASANTPSGAITSTQCTITTIASAMALKKLVNAARCAAARRVAANPNRTAKITSARIALSAAAAMMFGGSRAWMPSCQPPATAATSPPCGAAATKSAAVFGSSGHAARSPSDSTTASPADANSNTRNQVAACVARRPVANASETPAMADTSIANTSGPTVMRSALSHSVPMVAIRSLAPLMIAPPSLGSSAPAASPAASDPKTSQCRPLAARSEGGLTRRVASRTTW